MSKENFQNELIARYKHWEAINEKEPITVNPFACLARDEMRKIKKIFLKNFHEPIDNYLK